MRIKLLVIAALISVSCLSQDHTAWRNGTDGIYNESGLLDKWPETGPEIEWVFEELGQGHSSPVVFGNFVYITGMTDGNGFLFKFDLNGTLIYKKEYGKEYNESYHGPRGSPVIAGDLISLVSGYGKVMCLKESNGEEVWSIDMVKDYGGEVIRWGYNETPVIDGDVIYCTPGGKN